MKRAEAVSRAGPGAAELMRNAFPPALRPGSTLTQSDAGTDVILNPANAPSTSRRFYLNQVVADEDASFDPVAKDNPVAWIQVAAVSRTWRR